MDIRYLRDLGLSITKSLNVQKKKKRKIGKKNYLVNIVLAKAANTSPPSVSTLSNTVELQWLEHLWDHEI